MAKTKIEPLLAPRGGLRKRTAWNKGLTGEEYKRHYKNGLKGAFQKGHQFSVGEKNARWTGGLPHCKICGKFLSDHRAKLCRPCSDMNKVISETTKAKISKANKGRPKPYIAGENNYNWKGGKLKRSCEQCGKDFYVYDSLSRKGKGRFCSRQCQNVWWGENHKGQNSPTWKGGIGKEPYPFNFDNELKELIRKRDGYKCQLCGCPQQECLRKLDVHHIDYIKENLDPDNLISLCRGCNSKVNYNRLEWTDYFRNKLGG